MSHGHLIPGQPAGTQETTLTRPVLEPSAAERARTIVAGAQRGTLATLAPSGYPFGSVVNLATDDQGRPLTFLSTLAPHTQYALADPRASVLVAQEVPAGADPLAAGRVCLVGDLVAVTGPDRARERFLERHPNAHYIEYGDFACYQLDVRAVRWVGGFGRMDWVDVADYAAAAPDPLREVAPGAIDHMNADHADGLRACCRVLCGVSDAASAVMTDLDRYGFDLVAQTPTGPRALRIAFPTRLEGPQQLRPAMTELVWHAQHVSE